MVHIPLVNASEPTYEYLKTVWDILKERPDVFEQIKAEVHKTARASAGGQMKAKYAREALEEIKTNASSMGGKVIEESEEITVIPAVLQAEGVRNGALQRFEDFSKDYRWYEGVPIIPEHKAGDPPVSHKTNRLGQIRNVRLNAEKRRVEAEAVLFNSKFISDDLARIKAGESFGGSIGFYADDSPTDAPQTWSDGQTYNRIESNFFGDHFSIVASPACPLGKCGFNVNSKEPDIMVEDPKAEVPKTNAEIKPAEVLPPQVNVEAKIDLSTVLNEITSMKNEFSGLKANVATLAEENKALKASEEVRINAQHAAEDALVLSTLDSLLLAGFKDKKAEYFPAFKANAALFIAQNPDKIDLAAFVKPAVVTPAGQPFVPHVNAADEDPYEAAGAKAADSMIKVVT